MVKFGYLSNKEQGHRGNAEQEQYYIMETENRQPKIKCDCLIVLN